MDAKGKPEKPIEDALKKLKLDPPSKASSMNMSGPKGASQSDSTSCISSADATSSIRESEVDQEASMGDQSMYYGYYYPGSNFHGEWDNQCCNHGMENLQIKHPAIQTDNGSAVYYFPGIQTGYNTYSPFLPGAIYGVDGQILGQGSYYPSAASPQTAVSPGLFPQPIAYGPDLVPAYPWDPTFFFPEEIQASTFAVDQTNPHNKQNHPSHGQSLSPSQISTTSKWTPIASEPTILQNQSHKPAKKAAPSVLSKGYGQINKFNSYANQGKGALLYPNSAIATKENGRSWVDDENLKPRNKLNSLADLNLLNEQNRGPRTNGSKTTSQASVDHSETPSTEKTDNGSGSVTINRDDYNHPDFTLKYEHALFFVIKSYSEDDIHKSIKYGVWASTPNGNKRLDNAFQVAHEKMTERGIKCPVFLFFSVNASGQFCGVAEMTGRIDYRRNMDFWQQDKWNGYFPVKWHIIKDVPNPQFRHIILENNEHKPVTNSRDTQEVKFPQGTEMLSIFKNYSSKTSILDDFTFYENRQKAMQEKRNKSSISSDHPVLKNVEPGEVQKPGDSESKSPNLDLVPVEVKEALHTGIAATK